jgi:hypothetical protein
MITFSVLEAPRNSDQLAYDRMEAPIMPVALPEPDGEREGVPLWLCPNCSKYKPLEDYGWKKRDDICPGQQVWFKQGWCNRCLEGLVKASE